MSLVAYSDSEDDASGSNSKRTSNPPTSQKRKRSDSDRGGQAVHISRPPPPLPQSFSTLYASNVRSGTIDDPTLHGGRRRQVAHLSGNWPGFVFLEWLPSDEDLFHLEALISKIDHHPQDKSKPGIPVCRIQSSLRSDLGVRLPLHVSLSAPLILTTDNKDAFEEELSKAIQNAKLAAFDVSLSGLQWVKNFDGTRHFLILVLKEPLDAELQNLLSVCNGVAKEFRLPQLYAGRRAGVGVVPSREGPEPRHKSTRSESQGGKFHISIAWCLSQPRDSHGVCQYFPRQLSEMKIRFDKVFVTIGNHTSALALKPSEDTS